MRLKFVAFCFLLKFSLLAQEDKSVRFISKVEITPIPIKPLQKVNFKMPTKSKHGWSCSTKGLPIKDFRGSFFELGSNWRNQIDYMDGMKIISPLELPECSVDQISIISGGVPHEIGDLFPD